MPENPLAETAARPREIIYCSKCDAENLAGATRCHECGAHLYLACRHCGKASVRVLRRCSHCGERLGRGALLRLKDRIFRKFTVTETVLGLVLFALAVLGGIWLIERLLSPEPEIPPRPEYEHTVPTKDPNKIPEGAEPAPKAE